MSHQRYGPPRVLSLKKVHRRKPASGEILIKIHASTVNRTDDGFLRARPFIVRAFAGLTRLKFNITGSEFSGQVAAMGDAVSEFEVGDLVFGFKDDDFGFACHAEYTTMPARGMIAKIPPEISFEQAAAALEDAHYAMGYIRRAKVQRGDTVLVNCGTGGSVRLRSRFSRIWVHRWSPQHRAPILNLFVRSPAIIDALDALSAAISIGEAAKQSGVGLRTFQRFVSGQMGKPPTFWLQLARARRAARTVGISVSLARVAQDCGYSDQAHMTREFQHWFRATPARFAASSKLRLSIRELGYE